MSLRDRILKAARRLEIAQQEVDAARASFDHLLEEVRPRRSKPQARYTPGSVSDKVVNAIAGGVTRTRDLLKHIGGNPATVRSTLAKLARQGSIKSVKRGEWEV